MNVADLLLLLIVLLFALRGLSRGLMRELCAAAGVLGGLAAAIAWTPSWSTRLEASFTVPSAVAVGVTFMLIYTLVSTVAGLTANLFRRPAAGVWKVLADLGGAAIGGSKAAVVIGFLVLFSDLFRISPQLDRFVAGSLLVRPLVASSQAFLRSGVTAIASPASSIDRPRE